MNYTEKYHLPQWDETDRIMRVDFNEAMSGIEAGLTANAADAARAEEKADLPAIATGYYVATRSKMSIVTGFRPSFLIISTALFYGDDNSGLNSVTCFGPDTGGSFVSYTDDGFTLTPQNYSYPNVYRLSNHYTYIAFR